MAEDKKVFLQGKMNQDIDDRILPKQEYREAQNIQITTSEGSDVGAIQNVNGNELVGAQSISNNSVYAATTRTGVVENIGCFFDEKNSKIYYFLTDYTCPNPNAIGLVGEPGVGPVMATFNSYCAVWVYNKTSSTSKVLVQGSFLNFSTTHKITGVNLLEDLLFWTDGLNQPRKFNVKKAITNVNYYLSEDKISVAKFAPFMSPLLLDPATTTLNANEPTIEATSSMSFADSLPNNLVDKFIRFSYRFKFTDGEYSSIAPFTQICFIPKTTNYGTKEQQQVYEKGEVSFVDNDGNADGMVNSVNKIGLNILLPSKNIKTDFDITSIEILYKESNNNVVRAVELIELERDLNNNVFHYDYKSTLPYKTLPQEQLTRVYDNVPLSAKAQEVISNRVVYGNFVQDRNLNSVSQYVRQASVGLNFVAAVDKKFQTTNSWGNADFNNYYIHKEYPVHSIKQRRTYELGIVLADKFGRQSPVLTSSVGLGSINVPAKDEDFFAASWDQTGTISSSSAGNEDYCGDALEITFSEPIQNPYAKGKIINLSESTTVAVDITNNTVTVGISVDSLVFVNDYLKGNDKDFVKITNVDGNVITCDGPPSLDLNRSASDVIRDGNDITYALYTYKITPHGWYSYRIVVKQTEQEYYNVYTSGAFNYDNGKDETKTYFTLIGDNINKIVRDKEFANSQETGLSTSKAQIFPKVVQEGTQTTVASVVSNAGLLNVISIGTAKEQGLVDFTENVLAMVTEAEKNPMVVQIPYGSTTNEFGQDVSTAPSIFSSISTVKRINQGKSIQIGADEIASTKYGVGKYLKGQFKDLVKITKTVVADSVTTIDCDDVISDLYSSGTGSISNTNVPFANSTSAFYTYKHGKQEVFSVFETKPVESALDIFYETSTNGLVHELNEAANFVGGADTLTFIETEDFNEGTSFYPEGLEGNADSFLNVYAATIEITDVADSTIAGSSMVPTLQAVRFDNIEVTGQDVTDDFEIIFDDTTQKWKIKPNVNFIHEKTAVVAPYNAISHPTYYFDISVEANNITVPFLNIPLELQNVAPIIANGPNHTVEAASPSPEAEDDTLYQVKATNGSNKGDDYNTQGLFYTSSSFIFGNVEASSFGVQTHENYTNLSENLQINVWSGEIRLNPDVEYFGSLDQTVTVRVYDSNDYNNSEQSGGYAGVNEGNGGGIYAEQEVNFLLGDGLIVIESSSFLEGNYKGPYAFESPANVTYTENSEEITNSENFLCGYMHAVKATGNPFDGGIAGNWTIDLNNLTNGLPTIRKVQQTEVLTSFNEGAVLSGYKNLYPFFETNQDNEAFNNNDAIEFSGNSETPRNLSKYGPGGAEESTGTNLGVDFNFTTSDNPPGLDENLEVRGIQFISVNTSKATAGGVIDQNNTFDPQGFGGVLADFSYPRGTAADFSFGSEGAGNFVSSDGWVSGIDASDLFGDPYEPEDVNGSGGYPYFDFSGNVKYLALPHERRELPTEHSFDDNGINDNFLIKTNYTYVSPGSNAQYAVLMDVKKIGRVQESNDDQAPEATIKEDLCELIRVFLARI